MGTVAQESVGTDWRAVCFDVSRWVGSIILGVFTAVAGVVVVSLAVPTPSGGALAIGAVAGGVLPLLFLVGLATVSTMGTEVRLHRDRVEVDRGVPFGATTVDYADVAMAVRTGGFTDDRFGVGDFELVREGADNVSVEAVKRPDDVERALDENVPSVDEWFREHGDGDTALHATQRRRWWLHHYRLREAYHDDEHDVDDELGEWVEEADWYDAVDVPFDAEQPDFVMVDVTEPDADPGAASDGVVEPEDVEAITGVDFANTDLDQLDDVDDVADVGDIDAGDIGGGGDAGGGD